MSSPRFPDRDLRLERLSERDGLRPAPFGEVAHAGEAFAGQQQSQATYETLIDAVFTAPGVVEWLRAMSVSVAAFIAGKESSPHTPVARDAIRLPDARHP